MKQSQFTLKALKSMPRLWILCLTYCPGLAQFQFQLADLGRSFHSGLPVCATDINGDYLPDLLVLDKAKDLWLGTNCGEARFHWSSLGFISSHECWSINVADVDNNGLQDILIGGDARGLHVLYQSYGGFKKALVHQSKFFSQSANLHDMNQDGWVDAVVCDDNDRMRLYLNDKAGRLVRDTHWIKFGLPDPAWNSGNYGSTCADYDRDGDSDLYVAKCKAEIEDPLDGRRRNLFYVKQPDGYREMAGQLHIDFGDQSWAAAFEDFDGNALPDLVVLNHYSPSRFLKQRPDHQFDDFTDVTGIRYDGIPIQMAIEDWDNDGDQDILFAGTKVELYLNDGRMRFTKGFVSFDQNVFKSMAVADFNGDGFLDIYAVYPELLNNPSNTTDKLWLHPGNKNHYLGFHLKGLASNSSGIGTQIEVYAGNQKIYKELKSGTSFGLQHSHRLHVGLGSLTRADSLMVFWPSGLVEKYYDIEADKNYLISEGKCLIALNSEKVHEIILCNDDVAVLKSDLPAVRVLWSNGQISDSIKVAQSGLYYSAGLTRDSCWVMGKKYFVHKDPPEKITLNYNGIHTLCAGEELVIELPGYTDVEWQDGSHRFQMPVSQSGLYYAKAKGACQYLYSDTLIVQLTPPLDAVAIPADTLVYSRDFEYAAPGDVYWYKSENAALSEFIARGKLEAKINQQADTFWANRIQRNSFPLLAGGLTEPEFIRSAYNADFVNGQMLFLVFEDFILDSLTVFTDFPGQRKLLIKDPASQLVFEREYYFTIGRNRIHLGAELREQAGFFTMLFDEDFNKSEFGNISPKLKRSDKGFSYPMALGKLGALVSSHIGEDYYYYFYQWAVRPSDKWCSSERKKMVVRVSPSRAESPQPYSLIAFNDQGNWRVRVGDGGFDLMRIFDLKGRLVLVHNITSGSDILVGRPTLPSGLYVAQFSGAHTSASFKFWMD